MPGWHQLRLSEYRKKARKTPAQLASDALDQPLLFPARYLSTSFREITRRLFRRPEYHLRNSAVCHIRPDIVDCENPCSDFMNSLYLHSSRANGCIGGGEGMNLSWKRNHLLASHLKCGSEHGPTLHPRILRRHLNHLCAALSISDSLTPRSFFSRRNRTIWLSNAAKPLRLPRHTPR